MNSVTKLVLALESIPDPRIERTRLHRLSDILTIAVLGVICGAEGWEDIEDFGKQKKEWLRKYLKMENGIPSHDTIARVFRILKPELFHNVFQEWLEQTTNIVEQNDIISIDGKALRGSHDRASAKRMLHSVSAWSNSRGLMLGQQSVSDKSNEITAIPKLLEMLELQGAVVTIDAMGCQSAIAQQIIAQEGDYMLAVKDNQPTLNAQINKVFDAHHRNNKTDCRIALYEVQEVGHGRSEHRVYFQAMLSEAMREANPQWCGMRSFCQVISISQRDGKQVSETRNYISSLGRNVKRAAKAIRSHWGIENSLHWVLDVSFREDESRIRKDHGPENLALVRRIALNILKQDTSAGSIKRKRKRAGWSNDYLEEFLNKLEV